MHDKTINGKSLEAISAQYFDEIATLSDHIWHYAEVQFETPKSSRLLGDYLVSKGFDVTYGVSGVEHAFVATWGSGPKTVGFLAEFDALEGMGQKALAYVNCPNGSPGHGCGHNLLGAGAVFAALLCKDVIETEDTNTTIKVFGCPAEESGYAKAIMAEKGVFDGTTFMLTWHPNAYSQVWVERTLAVNTLKLTFCGKASHASGAPECGRSALDACELMNVGVNYLREHMPSTSRIHYAYLDAGGKSANVVQQQATLHYYVRAENRDVLDKLVQRVKQVAKGAALMTETTVSIETDARCLDYNANEPLSKLLESVMHEAGVVHLDDHDLKHLSWYAITPSDAIFDTTIRPGAYGSQDFVSTDVGDVSWRVPTAQIFIACEPQGTPMHSWQWVDNGTSSVAHKGIQKAGVVLALTAIRALHNKKLLQEIEAAYKASL